MEPNSTSSESAVQKVGVSKTELVFLSALAGLVAGAAITFCAMVTNPHSVSSDAKIIQQIQAARAAKQAKAEKEQFGRPAEGLQYSITEDTLLRTWEIALNVPVKADYPDDDTIAQFYNPVVDEIKTRRGVDSVELEGRYNLNIVVGKVFDWDKVVWPEVKEALEKRYGPAKEVEDLEEKQFKQEMKRLLPKM